jgi:sec-independent protein translocase protein TatA
MLTFFPLGVVGPWQIVIIALVILLLFGGKKIPELMRGLGKGMKSFKEGMNEVEKQIEDIDKDMNTTAKSPDKIEKKEEYNK